VRKKCFDHACFVIAPTPDRYRVPVTSPVAILTGFRMAASLPHVPRFMTDAELREHFGLPERAPNRLRATNIFPPKDTLIGKTDSRAVENFFDRRIGLESDSHRSDLAAAYDGKENFSGISKKR